MENRIFIFILIINLFTLEGYTQSLDKEVGPSFLTYLQSKENSIFIEKNDTIKFISEVLQTYKGGANKNEFLNKYVISDSVFDEYPGVDSYNSRYKGRLSKRIDFNVLVIIYFELYLKYKQPKNMEIITFRIVPDNKKNIVSYEDYTGKHLMTDILEDVINDIGKQYVNGQAMNWIGFKETYVPAHLTMDLIYESFINWIKKVEKIGSLEKARKRGLDPFKGTGYRFNILYSKKIVPKGMSQIILIQELNSYYPRFPLSKFIEKKEYIDRDWNSSYKDSKRW